MAGFDGVVELFAGPGGWSTGLRMAGYTERAIGIEWDMPACRTAIAAGHERICADVAAFPPERFAGADGLICSPPCQSFSNAGKRLGLADPRGQLVTQPLRWAGALLPRWIACEQVPEVLPIWQHNAHQLRTMGYSAWAGTLCAADYGVPQTRVRAFLIARRDGIPAGPPAATHSQEGGEGLFGAVPGWVSMADALGWGMTARPCNTLTAGSGRSGGPDPLDGGSGARELLRRERKEGRWVYRNGNQTHSARRAPTEPAPTEPAPTVHFSERSNKVEWMPAELAADPKASGVRVTIQEAGVLQGFPGDYPWRGTKTSQYRQVGDAVCPPLAAAILRSLVATKVLTGEERAA